VRDIGVGPDDVATIVVVEALDSLARIASDLAQRVDGVGDDARQDLHRIVAGPWPIRPLVTPAPDDRLDLLRPVELRDAQITEVFGDAV
jgi:hypothetical protein